MARAYCTLDQVKRLLRTAYKKVKTSEAYKNLGWNSDNTGTVRLTAITFKSSYVGSERFTITFSDSTSFEVIGDEIGYLGAGTTNALFDCSYFTIGTGNWTGTPDSGDSVYFESNSNISTDDANDFIEDACNFIRNKLGFIFSDSTNIPWEADLSVPVPDGIEFAAIRFAAYDIYASVIAGMEIDQEAPVVMWYKLAMDALVAFIKWWEKEEQIGAPQWRSRDLVVGTQIGIDGEGETDRQVDVEEDTVKNRNHARN
jgi:hypothetical protein